MKPTLIPATPRLLGLLSASLALGLGATVHGQLTSPASQVDPASQGAQSGQSTPQQAQQAQQAADQQRAQTQRAGQPAGQGAAQPDKPGASQWHTGDQWFDSTGAAWAQQSPGNAPYHVWDPQTQTWVIVDRQVVDAQYQAVQRGESPPQVDPQRVRRLTPEEHLREAQPQNPQADNPPQAQDEQRRAKQQARAAAREARQLQAAQKAQLQAQQAQQQAQQAQAEEVPQRQQAGDLRQVTLQGRIEGFRELGIQDESGLWQDHTLVRIRLDNGSESVVDIGRRMDLEDIALRQGQAIQIEGHTGLIDGREVLVADHIQAGEQTLDIARDDQRREISGRIAAIKRVDLPNDRNGTLLVRLQLENGTSVVVDFGPDTKLDDLALEKNSQVRVRGERQFLDGKSILVAKQVSVDGQTTNIAQPNQDKPQRQPRPQPQRQEQMHQHMQEPMQDHMQDHMREPMQQHMQEEMRSPAQQAVPDAVRQRSRQPQPAEPNQAEPQSGDQPR